MRGPEPEWLTINRDLWDEMAAVHVSTEFYDLPGIVEGRDDLRPWEDEELGSVAGLDLVHLQCHIGTDTIGWARRGANVVGVDLAPEAIRVARDLSGRCGLDIDWIESDVYQAPVALSDRSFDVGYTGIGALGWLPDLDRWAEVVRALLRPGGVLYLVEVHPMWTAVIDDGHSVCQHAIGAPFERWDEEGRTSYADSEHVLTNTSSFERLHSVSDVISAVLSAGLVIELFHEFDVTPAPTPWLERGDDRLFRFPADIPRFPLTYSLRARQTTT